MHEIYQRPRRERIPNTAQTRTVLGPRAACKEALRRIGGWTEPNVTQRTDFLVIGTFASRGWKTGSIGNKILKAADYREKHGRPKIIGEDHWASRTSEGILPDDRGAC